MNVKKEKKNAIKITTKQCFFFFLYNYFETIIREKGEEEKKEKNLTQT